MTGKDREKIRNLMEQERNRAVNLKRRIARMLDEGVSAEGVREEFDELCVYEGNVSLYMALLLMETDGYFDES